MFDKENIRIQYLKTLSKIRNFLLSQKSREFLIFLFFVFVSFSFWLLQVLNDDYSTELSIPLRMKNVPENVVVTSDIPDELRVGVKDRGTVLVNYMVGHTFFPVNIDFLQYASKGNQVKIPVTYFLPHIRKQLNQTTKVSIARPDTIELYYTRGEGKKVPVKLTGKLKPEKQYYIADTIYSPDSVMVYAPPAILQSINEASTQPLYIEHIADTTEARASISPVRGAKFVPPFDDIKLLVDIYSEKTVEVPVQKLEFPEDKVLRTFPSKVKVSFQVGLSRFKEFNAEDFEVGVKYSDLLKEKKDKCKLILLKKPHAITHARIIPAEIDYIIEQR